MTGSRRPAIFLFGPTASGKSALALTLAERFPLTLISVDSTQVYRGLDVGSAKPDAATRARFPHALVDLREPEHAYSAADFARDARAAIEAIWLEGRVPLLVGGTMLYFEALERGLSALPAADPALRAALDAEAMAIGWPALHLRLAAADPEAAVRIHPNDPQRIGRALEVIALSGRSLSSQRRRGHRRLDARLLKLALVVDDRAALGERIAVRFDRMIADGLLAEVTGLRARPQLSIEHPSMRSVGYRQAWRHLAGEIDYPGFRAQAIIATRQLAKRQMTWIRREHDALASDPFAFALNARVERLVADFLGQR